MIFFTLNNMSFMEFIKTLLTILWILAGFFIFYEDLTTKDIEDDEMVSNTASQSPLKVVDKVVEKVVQKTTLIRQTLKAEIPTLPPVSVHDDEEKEDNAFKNIQIFSKPIQGREGFYERLQPNLQKEFKKLFVDEGPDHLSKDLNYVIGEKNSAFFEYVFNDIYDYRKVISPELLKALMDALQTIAKDDPQAQSYLFEAGSRTAYSQRHKQAFLALVDTWTAQDIEIQKKHLKPKNRYVYSYVRRAILLEKQGDIEQAIQLVDEALQLDLDDRTQGNYQERKVRLLGKMPKVVEPIKEEEPEEEADEAALESIEIFKTVVKERKGFYESLTIEEQQEFDRYYVLPGEQHLAKELQYTKGGQNDAFFTKVFNYIYRYRKLISSGLLIKLSDELQTFTLGDPSVQTILYELAIRVAYYRRKDATFFNIAKQWAQQDVALQQSTLNARDKYVYSFTRLAIILEKQKNFDEALKLIDDALARNLTDKTRTGYQGRRLRILKKKAAIR